MPRRPFEFDPNVPYHVFNRCINKDWFAQPMDEVWKLFCVYLWFVQQTFELKIHSFVLMSNHYHLLVTAPKGNLSEAMGYMQSGVSRELTKAAGRINHTFSRRYGRCRIGSYNYYLNAYKYIYFNPVDAGLSANVESYKYSSLGAVWMGSEFGIPIDDEIFKNDIINTLRWLNRVPPKNKYEIIGKAMYKNEFKYSKRLKYEADFADDEII